MADPITTAASLGVAGYVFEKLGGKELTVRFLGPTADCLGEHLKAYAEKGIENFGNVLKMAREKHRQRNVKDKPEPMPHRYAIKFIQGASLEDDETVQNLWAGLLANSTDPNKRLKINKLYMEVLSSFEPLDASVLKFLSRQGINVGKGLPSQGLNLEKISKELKVPMDELKISIYNLMRLGCITSETKGTYDTMDAIRSGGPLIDQSMSFRVSSLGISLLIACDIQ